MDLKVLPLFPILLNVIECKNFKSFQSNFIKDIENFMNNNEGVTYSNKGGYQSTPNFHKKEPLFQKYFDEFEDSINLIRPMYSNKKIKVKSTWFNVNFPGNYNMLHTHPTSTLTGVWWIKIPENSGTLFLESPFEFTQFKVIDSLEPRVRQQFGIFESYNFVPEEGTIVLFPSDIKHSVTENNSKEKRISIAFNLDFEEE